MLALLSFPFLTIAFGDLDDGVDVEIGTHGALPRADVKGLVRLVAIAGNKVLICTSVGRSSKAHPSVSSTSLLCNPPLTG